MTSAKYAKAITPSDIGAVLKQVGASLSALGELLCTEPPATSPDDVLTVAEAGKAANVGSRAIYRRIADGTLRAVRPAKVRGYRIVRRDLDALFAMPTEIVETPVPAPVKAREEETEEEYAERVLRGAGLQLRRSA